MKLSDEKKTSIYDLSTQTGITKQNDHDSICKNRTMSFYDASALSNCDDDFDNEEIIR
jgi:hypothetical protein